MRIQEAIFTDTDRINFSVFSEIQSYLIVGTKKCYQPIFPHFISVKIKVKNVAPLENGVVKGFCEAQFIFYCAAVIENKWRVRFICHFLAPHICPRNGRFMVGCSFLAGKFMSRELCLERLLPAKKESSFYKSSMHQI